MLAHRSHGPHVERTQHRTAPDRTRSAAVTRRGDRGSPPGRIAFLGLGRMGAPMARRLVDAGHDVVVWNRTASKAEGFAQIAQTPSKAADQAEIVITMLTDAPALREVVYDTGLDKVMRIDGVFVDM